MLGTREALGEAAEFLRAQSRGWGNFRVRLEWGSAFVDGGVLVVCWDSVAYLDEGDEDAQLGGNMPVKVDLGSGECGFIDMPQVMDYMERGLIK